MTNTRWEAALSPLKEADYVDGYVAVAVRTNLDNLKPGEELTTTQLAHVLWPPAEGDPSYQRQRLFKVLQRLATRSLAGYCHRGEPKTRAWKRKSPDAPQARPWVWHAERFPHEEAMLPPICPHCGGELG